jgi:hypothetical protein
MASKVDEELVDYEDDDEQLTGAAKENQETNKLSKK